MVLFFNQEVQAMEYELQKIIMDNIDALLKKRGMKPSELEKMVGIKSPGYLSRLKNIKPDGTGLKMSYKLLKEIADSLKVSIDYLTLNTLNHTTDENALIDFFESLYTMSVEDSLYWQIVSLSEIEYRRENDHDFTYLYGPIATTIERATPDDFEIYPADIAKSVQRVCDDAHGFVLWSGWLSLKQGREIEHIMYTSAFPSDDFFYTNIDKINSTLFLYRVEYTDMENHNKLSDIIEAYLVKGEEKHFLCNSIEWGDYISSKLKDLYQIAKDKCSGTRLNENARKLLNLFNAD
jgi:transcriptional regulator with XRE-family HTH domain